ncbi:hypothetical protein [Andreprevotia lacus]|nr:hypothetical protein [Andreprevotia lacus]
MRKQLGPASSTKSPALLQLKFLEIFKHQFTRKGKYIKPQHVKQGLTMENGPCLLCNKESELQLSHIIPSFVFRWLRESAGNGHLRMGTQPNLRAQDGLKRYWLCSSCEGIFSQSERYFANHIFYPYLKNSSSRFNYDSWLIHFCTSISWRVLCFFLTEGHVASYPSAAIEQMKKAEIIWREHLLGERLHPGPHQQHLLPMDQVASVQGKIAPNINRYLMRAIDIDLCHSHQSIFTYAKLGRFIILGFISESTPNRWRDTKVNAKNGTIEPKSYTLPAAFGDYINHKAQRISILLGEISEKQKRKIDASFRKNIDNYIGSDAHKAMVADIELFGETALK